MVYVLLYIEFNAVSANVQVGVCMGCVFMCKYVYLGY